MYNRSHRYTRYKRPYVSSVERETNVLIFGEKVNSKAHRDYMYAIDDALNRGYEDIHLDFSDTSRAYSDGMVAILCSLDALRRDRIGISATLPAASDVERLFINTNWAHFLSPYDYPQSETTHDRHLAVKRFRTFEEQQAIVNDFLDIVMRNMTLERDVIAGLAWSINEITDNVLNHA